MTIGVSVSIATTTPAPIPSSNLSPKPSPRFLQTMGDFIFSCPSLSLQPVCMNEDWSYAMSPV